MTPSGGDIRASIAPPERKIRTPWSAYFGLLVSGLAFSTAFAGIADLAGQQQNGQNPVGVQREADNAPTTEPESETVPGNASPEETTVKVSGSPHGGERSSVPPTTTTTVTVTSDRPTTTTTTRRTSTTSWTSSWTSSRTSTTKPPTSPPTTTPPTTEPCEPQPDCENDDGGGGEAP